MCWFYFMPNLLVIQHLETLYLGRNNIRLCVRKCEELIKCVHEKASRDWTSRLIPKWWLAKIHHTCKVCRKLKGQDSWITTRQKVQSDYSIFWRLELMTYPSRKLLASAPCFAKKWLFTFLLILYYKNPYTHEMLRASKENFER